MTTSPDSHDLAEVYSVEQLRSVLVLDGYGVALQVRRGHLVLTDGVGQHRRTRTLARADRTVRRIAILGHTGHLTLEAIRWCADVGIRLVHIDTDGRLLSLAGGDGRDDARLRRAQAQAGPATALAVARLLLGAKLHGQAAVATEFLDPRVGASIKAMEASLADAPSPLRCREIEATAAAAYFAAWTSTIRVRFARHDQAVVPVHWHTFAQRHSPLGATKSPFKATDPINATLNYAYAIAETECRIAILAVGLDPGHGFVHNDAKNRDSLALDVLEAVRPTVERYVLQLLTQRTVSRRDFHETRDGNCRLLPPLTHTIAEAAAAWATSIAPYAERVAHMIADSSTAPIRKPTPLTGDNKRAAQRRGTKRAPTPRTVAADLPAARCLHCGGAIATSGAGLCPACNTADLPERGRRQTTARQAILTQLRAEGHDPAQTARARSKRSQTLRANRAELAAWQPTDSAPISRATFTEQIQPALASRPLSAIAAVTGLSVSACSRIRSGQLLPHQRHWGPLQQLVSANPA